MPFYMFDDVPIDISAKIGPAINMAPAVREEVTGSVGVRF